MKENLTIVTPHTYPKWIYGILIFGCITTSYFMCYINFYRDFNKNLQAAHKAYKIGDYTYAASLYNNLLQNHGLDEDDKKKLAFSYIASDDYYEIIKGADLLADILEGKKYTEDAFIELQKEFTKITNKELEEFFSFGVKKCLS